MALRSFTVWMRVTHSSSSPGGGVGPKNRIEPKLVGNMTLRAGRMTCIQLPTSCKPLSSSAPGGDGTRSRPRIWRSPTACTAVTPRYIGPWNMTRWAYMSATLSGLGPSVAGSWCHRAGGSAG